MGVRLWVIQKKKYGGWQRNSSNYILNFFVEYIILVDTFCGPSKTAREKKTWFQTVQVGERKQKYFSVLLCSSFHVRLQILSRHSRYDTQLSRISWTACEKRAGIGTISRKWKYWEDIVILLNYLISHGCEKSSKQAWMPSRDKPHSRSDTHCYPNDDCKFDDICDDHLSWDCYDFFFFVSSHLFYFPPSLPYFQIFYIFVLSVE